MIENGVPRHVGIIMDGNGRWAKKRGLPRIAGHKKGADVFGNIARHAAKTGISYLTVYAFSTENWSRPLDEVKGIMDLLRGFLNDTDKYIKDNIKIKVIGEKSALDSDIQKKIESLEQRSVNKDGLTLCIALNYGGRNDILRAAMSVAKLYAQGNIGGLNKLDESAFGNYLYTAGIPDVDLVIRTSGEMRISNFLLWQSAYAEYIFTDVLWPDFTPAHFDSFLAEYAKRNRRLGNI